MIGFLHPWMLAALPAVTLPFLLHLLARREPPTVAFPAVRYLRSATAEHQRRLRLQHWLLLLLRMLLVLALVLAAAAPTASILGAPGHAPSALVIILDNSASSGAVTGGTPRLERLVAAARAALSRATTDDALWLLLADGRARRGDPRQLQTILDSVAVLPLRLDLGVAISEGDQILEAQRRPGELMVLSDLQASALSQAHQRAPLLVARPPETPPVNRGVAALVASAQPWSSDGGRLVVSVTGDSSGPVAVAARLGDRPPRESLVRPGDSVSVTLAAPSEGWYVASAALAPDEFRLDDRRETLVRVAAVASASCDESDRYLEAACEVLRQNRRIRAGDSITIGRPGAGASIIMPPADAAEMGALNRELARRGSQWRYGQLRLDATTTDSGPLLGRHPVSRRYQLVSTGSGRTGVLVSAGGEPWMVRSGNLILLGSRLDPDWTGLPLAAGFMPFLDGLINRVARGGVALIDGDAGKPSALPDQVTEVRRGTRHWKVDGGDFFTPGDVGVYFLLTDRDTVGALVAGIDRRESALQPADAAMVHRLWPGARLLTLDEAGDAAFSSAARADLRGPLLWVALAAGLGEVLLASTQRKKA